MIKRYSQQKFLSYTSNFGSRNQKVIIKTKEFLSMNISEESQICVNLCCGTAIAPGWKNSDNSANLRLSKIPFARWTLNKLGLLSNAHYQVKWPETITYREFTKPFAFKDSKVSFLYTSHFIEHLSKDDAEKVFREIFRVLSEGVVLPE